MDTGNQGRRGNGSSRRGNAGLSLNPGEKVELLVDTTAEAVKSRFLQFLCGYGQEELPPTTTMNTNNTDNNKEEEEEEEQQQQLIRPSVNYSQQAEVMRNTETSSLFVDFSHVLEYDPDLAQAIQAQYYRFEPFLRRAVFEFIRMEDVAYTVNEDANKSQREFFVCFYNFQHVSHIRDLKTRTIGELVSFSGTVTRTSEVRPELLFGGFTCRECGGDTTGIEQQFKYTEPMKCQNPYCTNTFEWELNTEKSIFVDWQRVKVQENSDEIPPGSMPRSIDVILRHENVEQAKAGDRVVFTGTLIVVPDVSKFIKVGGENPIASRNQKRNDKNNMEHEGVRGLKALGVRELTYKTCFLACSVQTMEQRFNHISIRSEATGGEQLEEEEEFSIQDLNTIQQIQQDPNRYVKMARSICPSVYGHDEIRKGILLMLFGGVHKKTKENIKLRGDINICIVGDPSTAKSQFLKFICSFLPRAIYTSGKVSSAAGLTASVTRDVDTGEYCVEAGALMLADNGICCIDEFDKMDPMDQVAIHEAMEQQTISITKAGIQATLNARTSILAAANPYNGRYDKTKTLKYNVNISPPIMSRFDLFFVILDDCDEKIDEKIAKHIVNLHMPQEQQEETINTNAYEEEDLKLYIKYARRLNPEITQEAKRMMIVCYRRLRENDVISNGQTNIAYRITVRQLESMIRLSEALARMDLSEKVLVKHVQEAYRLLNKSIIHVDTQNVELDLPTLSTTTMEKQQEEEEEEEEEEEVEEEEPERQPEEEEQQQQKQQIEIDIEEETMKKKSTTKFSTSSSDVTLSFERFAMIQKALGRYIREKEEERASTSVTKQQEQDKEEDEEEIGVLQGELVTWYLSSQDITSEAQLIKEKQMICSVIDKLITDKFLLVVDEEEEEEEEDQDQDQDQDQEEDKDRKKQQRYLTVHPNYAFD